MGLSDLGNKIVRIGQDTKNGVQKMSDSVTINNKIQAEKKSLTRLLAMIGETVYKQDPDHPIPGMEDEYAAVKVAYGNLAKYREQLDQIKGLVYCPKCGKPAAEGDKFCGKCGTKLPAAENSTAGKVAADVKEAGEEAGKIARDPARRLKTAGGRPTAPKDALTEKQQQVLLDTVADLPVKLFIYLGLYAGLRREEICALRWDCVDLDGPAPSIRVRRACRWIANNKPEVSDVLKSSAAWRDIPIPPVLVKELTAAHSASASPWVICNTKGEPWSYATLRSAWATV